MGLPIAGDPLNHSALLSKAQVDQLRAEFGLDEEHEWDAFPPESGEGRWCGQVSQRMRTHPEMAASSDGPGPATVAVPAETGIGAARPSSTQEALGRILVSLARQPDVAARMVTTSPDVAVSTNLGGWINKMGVFTPDEQPDYLGEERLLRWRQSPGGHHIELGISEMNLFILLGQLGLSAELSGELLLPVGTLYDPFVCRGLDAFIYSVYSGARFVVAGTPSGVTLSPEGGAHQSTITASIGPTGATRAAGRCTSGCRPGRSTPRRSGQPRSDWAVRSCGDRCWRVGTGSSNPITMANPSRCAPPARSSRRWSRPPASSRPKASPRRWST